MKRLRFVVALGLLCVALGAANAEPMFGVDPEPFFEIHTEQEWRAALGGMFPGGMIEPVGGMVFEDMVRNDPRWPQQYQEATFFTPGLQPVQGFEGEDGMGMFWGPAQPGYNATAWDFVYAPLNNNFNNHEQQQVGAPVNLNGATIDFSIFPPWPSTRFSLNLIDKNGNYREWIWHATGNTGDPIPGQWNTVTINPATGTSNFGNAIMWDNTPLFDLGSISILRFDENVPWPPPDGWPQGGFPGFVPGTDWAYNLWNHVEVSPEPGTMVLVGSGLLGLLLKRRKNKKK